MLPGTLKCFRIEFLNDLNYQKYVQRRILVLLYVTYPLLFQFIVQIHTVLVLNGVQYFSKTGVNEAN